MLTNHNIKVFVGRNLKIKVDRERERKREREKITKKNLIGTYLIFW